MIKTMNDKPKLTYSVEQLAEATSLSKAHLRNEITAGRLRAVRIGRRVLIPQDCAEEYINQAERVEPKNGAM